MPHDYTSADTIAAILFCFCLAGLWGAMLGRWSRGLPLSRVANLAIVCIFGAAGAWSIYRVIVRLILGWVP